MTNGIDGILFDYNSKSCGFLGKRSGMWTWPCGKVPWIRDILHICTRGSHIYCKDIFKMSGFISSYPRAPFFKDMIIFCISQLVTGSRNIVLEMFSPINDWGGMVWFNIPLARWGPMLTKNVLNISLIVILSSVKVLSCNLDYSWTHLILFEFIIPFSIVQVFFILF